MADYARYAFENVQLARIERTCQSYLFLRFASQIINSCRTHHVKYFGRKKSSKLRYFSSILYLLIICKTWRNNARQSSSRRIRHLFFLHFFSFSWYLTKSLEYLHSRGNGNANTPIHIPNTVGTSFTAAFRNFRFSRWFRPVVRVHVGNLYVTNAKIIFEQASQVIC